MPRPAGRSLARGTRASADKAGKAGPWLGRSPDPSLRLARLLADLAAKNNNAQGRPVARTTTITTTTTITKMVRGRSYAKEQCSACHSPSHTHGGLFSRRRMWGEYEAGRRTPSDALRASVTIFIRTTEQIGLLALTGGSHCPHSTE